nr:MAG TPA: hypothetical protein [Caudoviricetes sp.]
MPLFCKIKTPDIKPGQFEKIIEMIPSIPKNMLSLINKNHKYKKELRGNL